MSLVRPGPGAARAGETLYGVRLQLAWCSRPTLAFSSVMATLAFLIAERLLHIGQYEVPGGLAAAGTG
jgi:hypothetical protein